MKSIEHSGKGCVTHQLNHRIVNIGCAVWPLPVSMLHAQSEMVFFPFFGKHCATRRVHVFAWWFCGVCGFSCVVAKIIVRCLLEFNYLFQKLVNIFSEAFTWFLASAIWLAFMANNLMPNFNNQCIGFPVNASCATFFYCFAQAVFLVSWMVEKTHTLNRIMKRKHFSSIHPCSFCIFLESLCASCENYYRCMHQE